jgi:hypothetical protein
MNGYIDLSCIRLVSLRVCSGPQQTRSFTARKILTLGGTHDSQEEGVGFRNPTLLFGSIVN